MRRAATRGASVATSAPDRAASLTSPPSLFLPPFAQPRTRTHACPSCRSHSCRVRLAKHTPTPSRNTQPSASHPFGTPAQPPANVLSPPLLIVERSNGRLPVARAVAYVGAQA
eukprot:355623-Chlamydomonas_euryale.AAC.9